MTTKKKPANKPAEAKGPTQLLKLKFEKFPDKQVGVYFEPAKRCFYADFGFEQYESPSVAGLEQKIKAAIKRGATPDVTWVPVISIGMENDNYYHQPGADSADRHIEFSLERKYVAITKSGFSEVGWNVPEKQRARSASRCYDVGYSEAEKMRVIPKLPILEKGNDPFLMLPYNEQTWQKLSAISGQVNAMRESLAGAIRSQDFSKVFIPKAAAAPQKTSAPKPAASTKFDPKQPEIPLGADHSESAKSAANKGLGKSLDSIRDQVKKQSGDARAAARRAKATNGDNTAREHLVVKYQGKQLTLGHGPLGNYLVEALRKTYPSIHSAFCLKDNRIQISLQGVSDPLVITGQAFGTVINNPPHQRGPLHGQRGDGVIGTPSPEMRIMALNGAIAKLQELMEQVDPLDRPVEIPSLILLAAGLPETASGEIHDEQQILIRVPKKPVMFRSLKQLENMIRERIPAAEPAEKDLVPA